jgi:hypothetical protein
MNEVQTLNHQGKEIVYIDFSVCENKPRLFEVIQEAKSVLKKHPLNSVLTLTNLTNVHFDSEVVKAFEEYSAENKPFVKAAALIGVSGFQKVIHSIITRVTKRNIPTYDSKQEAMDWLVTNE